MIKEYQCCLLLSWGFKWNHIKEPILPFKAHMHFFLSLILTQNFAFIHDTHNLGKQGYRCVTSFFSLLMVLASKIE